MSVGSLFKSACLACLALAQVGMPFSWDHIADLATPKCTHPLHIPDKASVYWVDYLLDDRPHKIRDAEQLHDYYQQHFRKYPRSDLLAEPRPWPDFDDDKGTTEYGIPMSALKYVPSSRIQELSNPVKRAEGSEKLRVIRLPPVGDKYKLRTPTWFQDSNSVMDSTGAFVRRSRSRRPLVPTTAFDFSRGDFRSRSRQRRNLRDKTDSSIPRLPPISPNRIRGDIRSRGASAEPRDQKQLAGFRLPLLQKGQGEGLQGPTKKWR